MFYFHSSNSQYFSINLVTFLGINIRGEHVTTKIAQINTKQKITYLQYLLICQRYLKPPELMWMENNGKL